MRLVVVSNRLPITITEEGGYRFQESVGGLVSGLKSYLDSLKYPPVPNHICKYLWVGWPGITIKEKAKELIKSRISSDFNSYPIFLSESTLDKFYNGFYNKTAPPPASTS